MPLRFPNKDPDERLDYSVDWSRYLGDLTISSVAWKIVKSDGTFLDFGVGEVFEDDAVGTASESSVGLVCANQTNTSKVATIVLDKGVSYTDYRLICEITTNTSSQTNAEIVTNREVVIKVVERV